MGVGKNIVAKRKEIKLTQYALAKAAGISQSGLSTIESEKNSATIPTLQAIASVLRCSVSDLTGEEIKSPTAQGDGLDAELVNLLVDLSPAEVQRVVDFVAGIKAARTEDASRQR